MTAHPTPSNFDPNDPSLPAPEGDPGLRKSLDRLADQVNRDALIQRTTDELREFLLVDRVVLYYFYREWKGQVTFESLSSREFSIFGETGPDDCFKDQYAVMYLAGRVRDIPDIEAELMSDCHRNYLRNIRVRANLVVPIVNSTRLWGLLIAHHCRGIRHWLPSEIVMMQKAAKTLAVAPAIRDS